MIDVLLLTEKLKHGELTKDRKEVVNGGVVSV
jgi:hypothetical protein